MILLLPSVALAAGLTALYRWRMGSVPWVFLLVATVVLLQGAIIEAFGVQAGAEVGSSSLLVLLVVTITGLFAVRPVWRLAIMAIICAIGAAVALLAYGIVGLYFDDLDTRIDEIPILLVPLALALATLGVTVARDLPWPPRRLMIASICLTVLFPLTRIGEGLETLGGYLAYFALALLLAGWTWLFSSLARGARTRPSGQPSPRS
jgi:hypothetical protein